MSLISYLHHPTRIFRKMRWQMMQVRAQPTELTADTWNGRLTFNSGDRLISKFLYVRGAYERDYVTQVMEFLDRANLRSPQRDVVLDVGANIGMISIALVKHGWFRRAIAFEPESYNYHLLTGNVRQNGYDDVIACRKLALSNNSCDVDLVINESNLGGHFIPHPGDMAMVLETSRSVRIKTATCDDVLATEFAGLADRVGLVWMDIEGHEGYFLQGALATLDRQASIPVVSEFYPRAIDRSGMSRDEYVYWVTRLFTHVCTIASGEFVERPIADVDELLNEHAEGATNVIYLRR
jgi:FkbM family methyltransferase